MLAKAARDQTKSRKPFGSVDGLIMPGLCRLAVNFEVNVLIGVDLVSDYKVVSVELRIRQCRVVPELIPRCSANSLPFRSFLLL